MSIASAVQMTSTQDVEANLAQAAKHISDAAKSGSQLIVLPEMFAIIGMDKRHCHVAEPFGDGPIQFFLQRQAKQHQVWLVAGTIPIQHESCDKISAACLVLDDCGNVVTRYNKMHLFDACIQAGDEEYRESDKVVPGEELIVVDTPVGKLGLAVCYDIRFPELFRALLEKGAEIIALPAAFTVKTGQAHWETLVRARAIENQCYLIAACQVGQHTPERHTFGHSMIVDPWGKSIASLTQQTATIHAEIDLNYLGKLRQEMPVQAHRRIF